MEGAGGRGRCMRAEGKVFGYVGRKERRGRVEGERKRKEKTQCELEEYSF